MSRNHLDSSNSVDQFIFMTNSRVISRGCHNDSPRTFNVDTMSGSREFVSEIETVPCSTLEIDDSKIKMVMRGIKELEELRTTNQNKTELLYKIFQSDSKFRTFLRENPQLQEQYDELMVMCKLAGLDESLFPLNVLVDFDLRNIVC